MTDKRTNEPFINIWFGNFYRYPVNDTLLMPRSVAAVMK